MFTERRKSSLQRRREKQPWPPGKPFKILSLDGGGTRGVYTASLLLECERHLSKGTALTSYFDMLAGSSTGGIIALGLAHGLSMQEIYGFYEEDGRDIFRAGRLRQILRCIRQIGFPKLNSKKLVSALQNRFGDARLGSSPVRLVIPAFTMHSTQITVFKTDHHRDFEHDHRSKMWKVACATSAAPTYFKGHEHKESQTVFLDGGIWANNPIMIAVIDALTCYDLEPEQIQVLSIGTGNPPFELKRNRLLDGYITWRNVIDCAMFLSTDNCGAQAKLLLGPEQCLRLEPTGQPAEIKLDDYDGAFDQLPVRAQNHFRDSKELLQCFFDSTVAKRERYYSCTIAK